MEVEMIMSTAGPQWPLNIYIGGKRPSLGRHGTLVFSLYKVILDISRTS